MNFRDFIPPVVYKLSSKLGAANKHHHDVFDTYDAAFASCQGQAYEDVQLVEVVFQKTLRLTKNVDGLLPPLTDSFLQSLSAILLAFHHANQEELKIIDFGGACGAHYFLLRPLLPEKAKVKWIVVETAAMTAKARQLANDELHFCNSISEARNSLGDIDLVHCSGTIQYVPDPENTLTEIMDCMPAFLFFNRLLLSGKEKIITVQETMLSANGPGTMPAGLDDRSCRYPVTYFPKEQLERLIEQTYQITFRLSETTTSFFDAPLFINSGFFAERY